MEGLIFIVAVCMLIILVYHSIGKISALVVLLLCSGAGILYETHRSWTPEKVEKVTQTSCPPGTSRLEVEAWLKSNPFPVSSTIKLINKPPPLYEGQAKRYDYDVSISDQEYVLREVRIPQNLVKGIIWTKIPDPNVDLLCSGTITLFFFFDNNNLLIKHYVRVWICSL